MNNCTPFRKTSFAFQANFNMAEGVRRF